MHGLRLLTIRAAQVQRSLLRAHLRLRYGLPDLLGALLSCVAPLLRHWRSQARVQEAFRVRPNIFKLHASLAPQGSAERVHSLACVVLIFTSAALHAG